MGSFATQAKARYNLKKYDRFLITTPKGMKDDIDYVFSKLGYKSRNDFILSVLREKMQEVLDGKDT